MANVFGQKTRLVVRMDDMGAFHAANTACVEGYKNGIGTTVEVIAVASWFPEAVKMLKKNPLLDVGLHVVLTSEWENVKWRPLTQCPSLVDDNGYFYPMMSSNTNYPNQALKENKWKLEEVEKELRAQIELTLKNIPQLTHITGHMGAVSFDDEVLKMAHRVAKEYDLSFVYGDDQKAKYGVKYVSYIGSNKSEEKEASFIKMLESLEKGSTNIFVDHPMNQSPEVETVGHIGYEWVAEDRQGVLNVLTSEKVRSKVAELNIDLINYNQLTKSLPRSTMQQENIKPNAIANYLKAIEKEKMDLHSVMILRNGKVVAENWFGEHTANTPHTLFSVSKTFTAMAVGFAQQEGLLKVTDKVTTFFPDYLPESISKNLANLEIKDLLTMSVGHDVSVFSLANRRARSDWRKWFLAQEIDVEPGTEFSYNSVGSYMLSAIVQKVTGEKVIDYLYPRLLRPLGITGAVWSETGEGINSGGWGLNIKTEDMAKFGQFILQKGRWDDKQLISETWINEMSSKHIESRRTDMTDELYEKTKKTSDWTQGYGYQMWRCHPYGAFRADGANGQFIIIIPEKNAVVVNTANIADMQASIDLIWKHIVSAMK